MKTYQIQLGADGFSVPVLRKRTRIIRAIQDKDESEVAELVSSTSLPMLNAKLRSGKTLLIEAAINNLSVLMKSLILRGVDLNATSESGNSALMHAIWHQNDQLAFELIRSGADCNKRNLLKQTPLHVAILKSTGLIISTLLRRGAGVNDRDQDQNTPLIIAAACHNKLVVNMLIDSGAEINALNKAGISPIYMAAINSNEANARALLKKGADFNTKPYGCSKTLLHIAVEKNLYKLTEDLIKKGADLFALDSSGKTPVELAKNQAMIDLITSSCTKIPCPASLTQDQQQADYIPKVLSQVAILCSKARVDGIAK